MSKTKVIFGSLFLSVVSAVLAVGFQFYYLYPGLSEKSSVLGAEKPLYSNRFWEYQCIDTMKYSRDTARAWNGRQIELTKLVDKQMDAIVSLGANCVAIGTPYDDEFVPFMKVWLASARERDLKIWFRGNLSAFEGWFDYPKMKNFNEHHSKVFSFITTYPELFEPGDIFTPSPETENTILKGGWSRENTSYLNTFLVDSYVSCNQAFSKISKKVNCGYFSSNGDVALKVLTQKTIDSTGGIVVIDHFVNTVSKMETDIKKLHDLRSSFVAIGEFGAPIPDINGNLTDKEKRQLIEGFLNVFYRQRKIVKAVNYWTLTDGSTALYSDDLAKASSATESIKRYYKPSLVSGTITDTVRRPLAGIPVTINSGGPLAQSTLTDSNGNFGILLPSGTVHLRVGGNGYEVQELITSSAIGEKVDANFSLSPINPSIFYQLKLNTLGNK